MPPPVEMSESLYTLLVVVDPHPDNAIRSDPNVASCSLANDPTVVVLM